MFNIAVDGGAPLGLSYGSGIMKIEFCTKICTLARVKKKSLPTKCEFNINIDLFTPLKEKISLPTKKSTSQSAPHHHLRTSAFAMKSLKKCDPKDTNLERYPAAVRSMILRSNGGLRNGKRHSHSQGCHLLQNTHRWSLTVKNVSDLSEYLLVGPVL